MTRRLLLVLTELRGPVGVRLVLACLGLAVLPLVLLGDALRYFLRLRQERRVLALSMLRCPRGHAVELVGAWECPSCGLVHVELHAFAPCPSCGAYVDAIRCACSLPLLNPLAERL